MLPTRIVHSGGGLQVFWDLREPIDVTDPSAAREVEEALKLVAGFVGGDPAVCEMSRLLRLPGSHNTKYGDSREVRVLVQRPGGYELSDLIDGRQSTDDRRSCRLAQRRVDHLVEDRLVLDEELLAEEFGEP